MVLPKSLKLQRRVYADSKSKRQTEAISIVLLLKMKITSIHAPIVIRLISLPNILQVIA